jgi:DNA repair protein RecO
MSAKRETTTRGIVTGRMQAGEGSARVLLYTEELGLVSAIAKSAREERSKLRPHLTIGTYGDYALVKGELGWRIVGATGTRNIHFILNDTAKQESCARVIGVVRSLVHGDGTNRELFEALWDFITTLPRIAIEDITPTEHRAVLGILAALGYVAQSDMNHPDLVSIINKGLMASGLAS